MRTLVTITESHPELLYDLEKLPSRSRSERLKTLAYMGLLYFKQENKTIIQDATLNNQSNVIENKLKDATLNIMSSLNNI